MLALRYMLLTALLVQPRCTSLLACLGVCLVAVAQLTADSGYGQPSFAAPSEVACLLTKLYTAHIDGAEIMLVL